MEKGVTPRRRQGVSALIAAAVLALSGFFAPGLLSALEAGALPLRPGALHPEPRQRGTNEIAEMPTRDVPCPACDYAVAVPEADRLMRKPAGGGEAPRWRMHAAFRDADLCPHPGPNKISYQADIIVCPSCGYAAPVDVFSGTLEPRARSWVSATFTDTLRDVEKKLLGRRSGEMTEDEIIAFFNRQQEIPDTIRTEHARIRTLARKDPALERAEITWLAAWAARRETASAPKGEFLSRRTSSVNAALANVQRTREGLPGEAEAIRHLLGKTRAGKERLGPGDTIAARLMLTCLQVRLGHIADAEKGLADLHQYLRNRFSRPDQDPLWSVTAGTRMTPNQRQAELNDIRGECEREVYVRLELVRRERELLREAVVLIREAVLSGELDGRREETLFYAYLAGEFLRRSGDLPLAAEWFKLVLSLAPEKTPVETAAQLQLAQVREQAGDKINLLSSIGTEGETFEKIRDICRSAP